MRFAVITDVHGNAPALQSVLAEIDNRGDIDHIYCLGDMIAIGPDTNQVLEILFARTDLSMITGNHDEAVLALVNEQEYPRSHLHIYPHHDWIASRIDKAYISKLATLPRFINKTVNNKSLFFIHYHIEKRKINKHISDDPFSTIVEPSLENMEKLFTKSNQQLICFGHHHPVHHFSNNQSIFLNPGSLGCHDQPTARFGTVTIDGDDIKVNLHQIAYDNNDFLKSYNKLKVPERQFILDVFHGNQPIN
ncbi:metallophosphoesterase family protein [Aquibacillus saliphilus]|uniref:metallophosphoesterase family protein n=1 Tax=Aquibacillus saliphilus TaxID=1909422 RepID=UPI001CF0279B|nr:metallophosphoesterase family protein [Aquibacillus saliphilus]